MKRFLQENKLYLITIVVIVALFQIKLPYYIDAPGGTIDISNRIEYDELEEYEGSLNMLYVTEYVATIPTYLLSYVIPNWDLEDISNNQISNESAEEIEIRNKVMLQNSINNAKYVAYQTANKTIEVKERKSIVIGTILETDLKIGDEILEIDGEKVTDTSFIKKKIEEKNFGDKLKEKIKRKDKELEKIVEVKEQDNNKMLGVVIVTNYEFTTDPEIELKFKSSESGSSGGLMMALSIYSAISGEDILRGRKIAGTGTIDMNGNVGEIGGIKYKIMGAANDKMDVVLVPSENYEEAKQVTAEKKYDLEIVEIKTFQDAIDYLQKTT